MRIEAPRCWVFGDDLNTDVIHPPQFFSLDPEVVKAGLFHGYDPQLQPSLQPGEVLIGGRNFGCGSSRETSIRSLKLNRIGAIVAVSFARIFFRNATNNGLPCLTFERPEDAARVPDGAALTVDTDRAELTVDGADTIQLSRPSPFIREIWSAGGLLELLPTRSGS